MELARCCKVPLNCCFFRLTGPSIRYKQYCNPTWRNSHYADASAHVSRTCNHAFLLRSLNSRRANGDGSVLSRNVHERRASHTAEELPELSSAGASRPDVTHELQRRTPLGKGDQERSDAETNAT